MALDVNDLVKKMTNAAMAVLKGKGPSIAAYAGPELKKIAVTVASIETEVAAGQINQDQASLLLDMQKNASRSVLLAVEGLGLLLAEEAINAALDAVKPIVNGALGWALL